MNPGDVPDDLVSAAAYELLLFDPGLSGPMARSLARVALAAVIWRVELRAGATTTVHVCTDPGQEAGR